MVVETSLKDYFANARRFDQDRVLSAVRAQRLAWGVAAISVAALCCSCLALAALAPFKTVEPYVIRVDNSTGIVDVVSALSSDKATYDEAVTKYFAARYVRAREGFSAAEAGESFRDVSLLSSADEQARFAAFYRGSNPESPQNVYRGASAKLAVQAISLIGKTVVSVRYLRTVTKGDEVHTTHWVATITYLYSNDLKLSATDRLVNPLGFVVGDYHSDPETVQP